MVRILPLMSLCVCIFINAAPIQSAKVVLFPYYGGSNYIAMKRIAQELAKRGHEVTLLVNSGQNIKHAGDLKHAVFTVPFEKEFLEKVLISSQIKNDNKADSLFSDNGFHELQEKCCESLLKDAKLLDSFKGYDLIVTDSVQLCGPIVADYLDIRRVEYFPDPPRLLFLQSIPYVDLLSVSYIPRLLTQNQLNMNFLQRVNNVVMCFVTVALNRWHIRGMQDLKVKYNIKPHRSYIESSGEKELTLVLVDFAFEYPQPIRPDYKMIGPLNIQPVKPLPPDLQQLFDSSGDDGAIIVSFGSNVASVLDKEKVDIMAEAFGRLKQKVIWRLKGYIPSPLSANIKVVDWLPQNNLLANEKLRAFISHAGLNSIYEAMYRGVPVVAIPLCNDQYDHAIYMEGKGVALVADYKALTADDLYNKIQRIINEPSFRQNAQRISRLLSDRPRTPVQEAGDWIEYTLRHESLVHLRPYSSQLAWYQYFLVDVAVFLVFVVLVVIMVIKYTLRLMCLMCCQRNKKQKSQ